MTYTLLLTTEYFMDEFAKKELKEYFKYKFKALDEGFYELNIQTKKELLDITLNLLYYTRTLTNIYLKVGESDEKLKRIKLEKDIFNETKSSHKNGVSSVKNSQFGIQVKDSEIKQSTLNLFQEKIQKEYNFDLGEDLSFEVFDEEEDGMILVLDLMGFNLTKRSYKLREFEDSLNPIVSSYAMHLLGLDKQQKLSILDPYAQLGDLSIESSLFTPRNALFIKEKRQITLSKLFSLPLGIPKKEVDKNKLMALIEGDEMFKFFRENVSYAGTKIKLSQFDFDWLDIKFHKGDFENILTQFPYFGSEKEKQEFEEAFFYQSEFVAKNDICVICDQEVDKKILEKHKLILKERREIEFEEEQYLIYVISHKKEK
jgi:23S rRNA G2445 N2-methylase RlmL